MTTAVDTGSRVVKLGAHPVGLDIERVRSALAAPKIRQMMERLRAELAGVKLILSVERLDYTKGILEKLNAYERLLEENPELLGKVTLVSVCVPAAKEMTIYDELQGQIEQAVGRINGRFARIGWTPLQFFFRSLPFEEVSAWYAHGRRDVDYPTCATASTWWPRSSSPPRACWMAVVYWCFRSLPALPPSSKAHY